MNTATDSLPDDLASAHAMIRVERAARLAAEAARSNEAALVAHLKLQIEKLRRELYGSRSERKARLLEQMELQLEDLETAASEDELAAENAAAETRSAPASVPRANPFPRICRVSALSSLRPRAARAAVRPSCRSSARTSPRRWK